VPIIHHPETVMIGGGHGKFRSLQLAHDLVGLAYCRVSVQDVYDVQTIGGQQNGAFGVAQDLDGLVDTPVRSCFLIDGDGVIRGAWRYEDDEVPDVEELARAAVGLGHQAQPD